MTTVITYGTFDLFHEGHFNLLKRAKQLGDFMIVGVTTENYDASRGKLNVHQNLMDRIENVKESGLADKIIIEEFEGQKILDIQRYNVDIFVIGSDWLGKFDYLNEYCRVIYLERTKGISSTQLRNENNKILNLGMIGSGRIASRFVKESKFVSGVNLAGVFGLSEERLKNFTEANELSFYSCNYDQFLENVDAIYVASPHLTHYEYAKKALLRGKHVLCEKPITLSAKEAHELFQLAKEKKLVLLEAIKTAFAPGFIRMVSISKSGLIGKIKSIDATFTMLVKESVRELQSETAGGSITELGSYPLLAAIKLMGVDYEDVVFYSFFDEKHKVDMFSKIILKYSDGIFTGEVGLGVKSEGDLIVSGTKGYIYVPSPWWKTEYFEARFEDLNENKRFYFKFDGDGLRYELAEFVNLINNGESKTYKLIEKESIAIVGVIEQFLNRNHINYI